MSQSGHRKINLCRILTTDDATRSPREIRYNLASTSVISYTNNTKDVDKQDWECFMDLHLIIN